MLNSQIDFVLFCEGKGVLFLFLEFVFCLRRNMRTEGKGTSGNVVLRKVKIAPGTCPGSVLPILIPV